MSSPADQSETYAMSSRFSTDYAAGTRRSASPPLQQPNYANRAVQEALEHMANIDLIELCNEAKVERCRATRDLRRCGRYVQYVLNSCGHASLCLECSQRCDLCPVCRVPISNGGNRLRPRLYNECMEAGLISKRFDERFQEKEEDGENHLTVDVQRLYSLFDVALENNLASLICHYITDVCMDESAVSSDPVIAFLLDEAVVKDWCKRTFSKIVVELQGIYNLGVEAMKTRVNLLTKLSLHLARISNVLEVLDYSCKRSPPAQSHDLELLQESLSKAKQHTEIMIWCVRHQFLENVISRYSDLSAWRSVVRERKAAAIKRPWPDVLNQSTEFGTQAGSLFIEDALENLDMEGHMQIMREESELLSLQKNGGVFFRSKIEGLGGCYPFESLRDCVDVLFLRGSSDMVVAKQSIFLYYLFDRHWTMPDETWRHLIDDFAATFGITRHSLLESVTFYLLDDCSEEALQEACNLLPEISCPSTHPKIAQVLLERENPEASLMVLRWSGLDGSQIVSLSEAVTAVRVRVECGLLTEAFMHQRMLCNKVRENKFNSGPLGESSNYLKGQSRRWDDWVEILVTEICCLCIKRNLVDRMIELPWNLDEEKNLHKCLLDYATHDPSTTTGSLLVVYYLQRHRYSEAYQVDSKLQNVEQEFISEKSIGEAALSRMTSASHWRAGLVATSIGLLPQVQQQHIKTGKLPPDTGEEVDVPMKSVIPTVQEPKSGSLLVPFPSDLMYTQQPDHTSLFKTSVLETPAKLGVSANSLKFGLGKVGSPSVLHERLFTYAGGGLKTPISTKKNHVNARIPTPRVDRVSPLKATPLKEIGRASLKGLPNSLQKLSQLEKISPEKGQKGFIKPSRNTPFFSHRATNNAVAKIDSETGSPDDRDDTAWNITSRDDAMDVAWSSGEKSFASDERNDNGGLRWSEETDDGKEEHSSEGLFRLGLASYATPGRRISRFTRKRL